ncbi:unnamed protein product [Aphanomyces euteiches]
MPTTLATTSRQHSALQRTCAFTTAKPRKAANSLCGPPSTESTSGFKTFALGAKSSTKKTSSAATTDAPSFPATYNPIQDNVDYPGFDIKGTSRGSPDLCVADCDATDGCVLFVWTDYNGGTCWLKHTVGVKSIVAGARASTKKAAMCGRVETGMDYPGSDIASVRRATPAHCCDDCKATKDCKLFVWTDFEGGTCWLKSARGSARAYTSAVAVAM